MAISPTFNKDSWHSNVVMNFRNNFAKEMQGQSAETLTDQEIWSLYVDIYGTGETGEDDDNEIMKAMAEMIESRSQ